MSVSNYAPRPLSISREYAGYQFYARLRLDGRSAGDCLRYTALTIQNWLCQRIHRAGGAEPEALACAAPADYMRIDNADLHSSRDDHYEILSLPEKGVWAFVLREPDPKTPARAFITHVGVRTIDGEEIEFGVHVDIVDSDPALPELEKAFRPQFVRLLFETEGMTLRQAAPLAFRQYISIEDNRGVKRLKDLAEDRGNQLPLVVFTHAQAGEKPMDMEQLMAGFMEQPPLMAGLNAYRPAEPKAKAERGETMPYDVAEFARHVYGFAQVYTVAGNAFGEFRAKYDRAKPGPGDILIIEPKAFGDGVRKRGYRDALPQSWYKEVTDALNEELQCYSKHKPYYFGNVLFIENARQLQREIELEELRNSVHAQKNEEVQRLLEQVKCERELSAEQAKHIDALRQQLQEEYLRGSEHEAARMEALERQLAGVKADCAELRAKNDSMQQAFGELLALRQIAEKVQTVQRLPRSTEDVVSYYRLVFADRIDFTERGIRTAAKCDINPELLWECLYWVSTVLVDLHRTADQNADRKFKEKTGWDAAMTEGPETHKVADYMNLRKDVYEGREISVEPHVKFPRSARRTGAQYQRLYYAYDPLSRKVIVGYVGDHLENYRSLSFH
ncbi:MAG: hypothetical protein IJH38_08020 [Clostridia bacterium]|nr:hypothetical protein [Clostridia bacterium]